MSHVSRFKPFMQASALAIGISFGSTAALAQAPAGAVAAPTDDAGNADIVVSGSRIDRAGFEAPTPTTIIGAEELRQGGRVSIAAVLNDLPQARATINPTNTSGGFSPGLASADLRGIGVARTLVLLDGRRFVGDNDLNSVPFGLVKRVDVVTGGASAAYGSGAVAGAINIILDEDYDGLELKAQAGISSRGDGFQYQFGANFGKPFDDGRGHIAIAAEYLQDKGIVPKTSRANIGRAALIANPGYTPTNGQNAALLARDVGASNASLGGLILTGVLAGQTFNPDGTLRPFQFGSLRSATLMSGGEGPSYDDVTYLTPPYERLNLFARSGYDLTDEIRLTADVRYSRVTSFYPFLPDRNLGNLAISVNNAFLPAAVRQRVLAAGQTSFTMGRFNSDFAFRTNNNRRQNVQGTVALEGRSGDWRWDAYYSHGEQRVRQTIAGNRLTPNFALAVDSVISPVSGLPICRIALTNPTTDCVPINLFGFGAPSQAATDYVTGTSSVTTNQTLDIGAASIRGEPFALWAGPVSLALGGEIRREKIKTIALDELSQSGAIAGGFAPLDGGYTVKEAFAEILVPLLRDVPVFRQLELNAAARISDYSTSGSLWSWKLGVTNRITDDLRVRATRSRDIRAGNLTELYTTAAIASSTIRDPVTGTQYAVISTVSGNPALDPETSDTWTAGAVYSPSFIKGLDLSVDYYDIDISGAVARLTAQDIISRCASGNAALCSLITRGGPGNTISALRSPFINLANYRTKGLDIELSYRLPLSSLGDGSGGLRFRALANHVISLVTDDGVTTVRTAGNVGSTVSFGVPKWRGVASIGYSDDASSIDLRARYVGGGLYDYRTDIANNKVKSRTYVDLTFETKVADAGLGDFTLFGSVSNLFDRDPPLVGNPAIYDVVGRYMQIGAKIRF